ncbi:homocysteine S-methyltransferase family protein [bacterium]|nr:homocysteine S-methyltransferase family protein [bacterium]
MNLRKALKDRIILKDGSIGISLSKTDAGKNVPFYELLNIESPQTVLELHKNYLSVSAEIITTNSFSAHPYSLSEWGFEEKAYEINFEAANLARKAVDESKQNAWIAGSMGPTAASLTLLKDKIDFDELKNGYKLQAKALIEGGADFLLIETIHDPLNAKAAWIAILELIDDGFKTDIALSMTVELTGVSLAGQSITSFVVSTKHLNPLYLGLNCSLGPQSLFNPLTELAEKSPFPVALVPNAGLPDEKGNYTLTPEIFASQMRVFLEKQQLNVIGGCCGTTHEHIEILAGMIKDAKPRQSRGEVNGMIAGLDAVFLKQEPAPMLVGERANTLGSKIFKKHVSAGNADKIIDVLRNQSLSGAHALDICFASIEQDEIQLWQTYAPKFSGLVKQPVFIDSARIDVIQNVLKLIPGKPVINSVNLEDGGQYISEIAKLLRFNPLAVVAGLIDENGMARTFDEKLAIAEKLFKLLVDNGFNHDEIIIDPLVFPLTADINPYESIRAITELKKKYPQSPTILGISNVSFGLPKKTRSILNSVYLQLALDAGLDIAIINVNDLARQGTINEDDHNLAVNILKEFDKKSLHELVEKYRGVKIESPVDKLEKLSLEERLITRIVTGIRDGLDFDMKSMLESKEPVEIINELLMAGMDRVGEMFGDGSMIISEVLLSAAVFKSAMNILVPKIKKESLPKAGKVILATVKGDVHDIGRNLVGMILESHGFEIIDLGTKVTPEVIIEAVKREKPIAVGLSGLLIRSAYIMRETAEALTHAQIDVPIVVGGAALTREFTAAEIAPAYPMGSVRYANNAMDALSIFKDIASGIISTEKAVELKKTPSLEITKSYLVEEPVTPPQVPDYITHVINPAMDDLIPLINWKMLIHKFMGAKLVKKDESRAQLEKVLKKIISRDILKPAGIFRFVNAISQDDNIILSSQTESEITKISFTRSKDDICASDWIINDSDISDSVAIFVVTSGDIKEAAKEARIENDLFFAYAIEVYSLAIVEAAAACTHDIIRTLWGLDDKTRGVRLSPGYSCCPDLEIQKDIFSLLKPESINVRLTDEMMMEPEASISAIVFHHPDGRYY